SREPRSTAASALEMRSLPRPLSATSFPRSCRLPEITREKMKMLLVEDDAFIRLDTAEILQDLGYDVIEADSGERGVEIIRHTTI
ncbi:hypothetical protein ACC754_41195, partial [Rhizobium johnstonii]